MFILHTESSSNWGGQEIRILKEAEGMRARGHEVILAVVKGGRLVHRAREQRFTVYEIPFARPTAIRAVRDLLRILRAHPIDLINTHSSLDAWLGGIAARLKGVRVIRTRHLSSPIRKGVNSLLLYRGLADSVITTSSAIIPTICSQAKISPDRCRCVPTGVDPASLHVNAKDAASFRERLGVSPEEFLIGTSCFVRSWKGIHDFMQAASLLREERLFKWVIIGGGHVADYRGVAEELGLRDTLFFTGHLENPYPAIGALDAFALLSTAHEGISQAALQAAFLKKPLITTPIGGLPEVCIDGSTGLIVPPRSPDAVAKAVLRLKENSALCQELGERGRQLVLDRFTFAHTLDAMEHVMQDVAASRKLNT
jgi:glycosyltransferase involved in cell wall biosynthesis